MSPNPCAKSYVPVMLLGGRQSLKELLHHKGSVLMSGTVLSYSWLSYPLFKVTIKGSGLGGEGRWW